MSPFEADRFAGASAAYVHIPFCSAVCRYCDFAVVAGRDELAERYVEAVRAEIRSSDPWRQLDSVYFGGGTPSRLDPRHLVTILEALGRQHGIADGAEITLEANPEDFSADRARHLHRAGFNRISFGAQSFDLAVLASLGRRHEAMDVDASVDAARGAGFDNISIDLIYGTPGETDVSWSVSVSRAIETGVEHVSCYALTVEPGTPLSRDVRDGADAPDPDVQADRYGIAVRSLATAGYERYEVSNWAKPGRECRYNLTVWAQGEYEAYGNGAHGFRAGRRYRNVRRIDAYIDRVISGRSPRTGDDVIQGWDAELDRVFVGLRRTVGVARGRGTEALLASDEGRALVAAGVVSETGGRLRVRKPLLTDAVHRSVLAQSRPIVMVDGDA